MSAGSGPATSIPRHGSAPPPARARRHPRSHQAVLARVRVECGERKPRSDDAKPRQFACGQLDRRSTRSGVRTRGTSASGDVDGDEHHPERGRLEHHRDEGRAGQVREEIGVPAPRQSGKRKGLLADGRRRDRLDAPVPGIVDGANDRVVSTLAAGGGRATTLERRGDTGVIDDRCASGEHRRTAGCLGRHARGVRPVHQRAPVPGDGARPRPAPRFRRHP